MNRFRVVLLTMVGFLVTIFGFMMFFAKTQPVSFEEGDLVEPVPLEEKFSAHYAGANEWLDKMSLEEKIGQLLFVRVPQENIVRDINAYHFGGYILFGRDIEGETLSSLKNKISRWQDEAEIDLFIGIDEEGGEVSRLSFAGLKDYDSPKNLYAQGGFELLEQVEKDKATTLSELGVNVNFAPVVDVCDDPNAYIFSRSFSGDPELVAEFAKRVVKIYQEANISATLKHFPGYAKNVDTHYNLARDDRKKDELLASDLIPYKADTNADFVMISHNIMTEIDADNPASVSKNVHDILTKDLDFSGIAITDDLSMAAISEFYAGKHPATVQAVLAGNNMLIVTDYVAAFNEIKQAVADDVISESQIDYLLVPVLALKIQKGLIKQ